jgi:transcriptional regulator with XRE-family HTH domain
MSSAIIVRVTLRDSVARSIRTRLLVHTGSRKPSFDTLRRLANALEITTDYLLGRTDNPNLAEAGDPLYRDMGKLTGRDRELAKDFLQMLSERGQKKRKD